MTKNHTIYSIKSNFCNQYMVWIKPIFDSKVPNFKYTRNLTICMGENRSQGKIRVIGVSI